MTFITLMFKSNKNVGILIAIIIITLWLVCVSIGLSNTIKPFSILGLLLSLVITHLYTGVFITAHDAMHGTVAPNHRKVNQLIGVVSTTLFAFNRFSQMKKKHYLHHRYVAEEKDPDYADGNFFVWYFSFLKSYISIIQIVLMGITFNVLALFSPQENIIMFWMLPSILSTFQLFYFGTYLPHRKINHQTPHKSGSQAKNHIWAFISCYFFGYHHEHHDSPSTPWWKLHVVKENNT